MKTVEQIQAEITALGAPDARFGDFKATTESLAERRAWRQAHPECSAQLDALADELVAAERQRSERQRAAKLLARFEASGVGSRTSEAVAEAQEKPSLVAAREWLSSGRCWLLLAGDVGTGKTVAAAWAIREVAQMGLSVAFERASMVAKLSGFDVGAAELARLKRVGLLVLDDLGTECATGWGTSMLHELLDTRHEEKLRTVLTSNLKRADARTRLGDRMADRIQQDGRVVWLEGQSMRSRSA